MPGFFIRQGIDDPVGLAVVGNPKRKIALYRPDGKISLFLFFFSYKDFSCIIFGVQSVIPIFESVMLLADDALKRWGGIGRANEGSE